MRITWLDSNSWLLQIKDKNILIDPWLVGSLVFGNLPWLFEGKRPQPPSIPEKIDLIILSQGLEDHAHRPTLEKLDRNIPVVASPNAAKVVQELGYQQVTSLQHGASFTWGETVEINAVPGSPIGPTLLENGYIIKDKTSDRSLYYEPHGYHSPEIQKFAPVDVVITPAINIELPLVGAILKGQESAVQVVEWLRPQIFLPTADAGEVEYEGLLTAILKPVGSVATLQEKFQQRRLPTQVIQPQPGKPVEIPLETQTATV